MRRTGARVRRGAPAAGLVAHGCTGAAQLRVVCATALKDAAFAVVAGGVDDCERGPATEPPPGAVTVGKPPTRRKSVNVGMLFAQVRRVVKEYRL
ncbi:hypothetical protein ACIHAR_31260 [Streptomyces sp. NPDC052016]|uniref:hypothetical protein n=1 Tax=Streptomyces sp. NPDC052016 TaxID=3365680 RepID=UPI0037D1C28F